MVNSIQSQNQAQERLQNRTTIRTLPPAKADAGRPLDAVADTGLPAFTGSEIVVRPLYSWIACALAHKACREGYTALYLRLPRLFEELALAHADGRFTKLTAGFAKTGLIVLDDWGLAKLTAEQRRDLFGLLDDRHRNRSTVVTSQLPVDHWHEIIGDPTLADAILDRLVHNAYRINLKGESMRKRHAKLTTTTAAE